MDGGVCLLASWLHAKIGINGCWVTCLGLLIVRYVVVVVVVVDGYILMRYESVFHFKELLGWLCLVDVDVVYIFVVVLFLLSNLFAKNTKSTK